ncbi:MAG: hypothetical protein OEW67_05470 [Cyclobacteriaceae bacterium]|nr:hypothetical protein [Cyclobacteriaceae bacterium]
MQKSEKDKVKEFFNLKDVFGYFFRKKRNEEGKKDINLKMMHVINRIAIIVFFLALLIWMFKRMI